jgi:hypothetical protein
LAELVRRAYPEAEFPEVDHDDPLAAFPAPRTWTRLPDIRALTADQSPMCVVTSNGIGDVARSGDGDWHGVWGVQVFTVIRDIAYERVADAVGVYVAAARVALLQHGIGFDGARKPKWSGESYHEFESRDARSMGAGVVGFTVGVHGAVNDLSGPLEVPAAPAFIDEDDPVVASSMATVDHV